jgi:hypothetical protein
MHAEGVSERSDLVEVRSLFPFLEARRKQFENTTDCPRFTISETKSVAQATGSEI